MSKFLVNLFSDHFFTKTFIFSKKRTLILTYFSRFFCFAPLESLSGANDGVIVRLQSTRNPVCHEGIYPLHNTHWFLDFFSGTINSEESITNNIFVHKTSDCHATPLELLLTMRLSLYPIIFFFFFYTLTCFGITSLPLN